METDRSEMNEGEFEANSDRLSESEFLAREARTAREALGRLRDEIVRSLARTADPVAWTVRYPWQSLATAAVAGLGAGVAMGRATRGGPKRATADFADEADESSFQEPHGEGVSTGAFERLLSGLGTLVGAMGSTVVAAATRAVAEIVKETVHDSLRPEPEPHTNGNGYPEGS